MAYIGRDIQYGTLDNQSFTANSSTTSFSLDSSVLNAKSLLVSVGGVIQEPEVAYTASGSALTFTEAPVTGNSVYAVYLGKTLEVSEGRQSISYQTGTGDNTTTPLTLSASPPNAQAIMVALDGIVQTPVTSYTVSGTTLTFAVVFGYNVLSPRAVLSPPVVFDTKASLPKATLKDAVVLFFKAQAPTATFAPPVVLFCIALSPRAVLLPPVVL